MRQEIPAGLYDRVVNRINYEEKTAVLKRRLILRSFALILSFFAFFPLALRLFYDVANSGLRQYFYLLFSDFGLVVANLGDYILTLAESTPMLSLSFASATLLASVFFSAKLADAYADLKNLKLI